MASDIRIVDPPAYFLAAQVNIGQAGSEMGKSYLLPRLVGGRRDPADRTTGAGR